MIKALFIGTLLIGMTLADCGYDLTSFGAFTRSLCVAVNEDFGYSLDCDGAQSFAQTCQSDIKKAILLFGVNKICEFYPPETQPDEVT